MLDILFPIVLMLLVYHIHTIFYDKIKNSNDKKNIFNSAIFAFFVSILLSGLLHKWLFDGFKPIEVPYMTIVYGSLEECFKVWSIFRIKINEKINDAYTSMAYFMIAGSIMMMFELFSKSSFLINNAEFSFISFCVIFWTTLNHIFWPGIVGYYFSKKQLLTGLIIVFILHGALNNYMISFLKLCNVNANVQIFALIFSLVTTAFVFLKCAKKAKFEYDLSIK